MVYRFFYKRSFHLGVAALLLATLFTISGALLLGEAEKALGVGATEARKYAQFLLKFTSPLLISAFISLAVCVASLIIGFVVRVWPR